MIRVVIVDDHMIVRRGLRDLIATTEDIEVVGEAADGIEALRIVVATAPDVVLMDLSMPNLDGAQATRRILEAQPGVQVVVLTSLADRQSIATALEHGAVGYLLKHSEPDTILGGIRATMTGGSVIDPLVARTILQSGRPTRGPVGDLTDRELQVLRAVHRGLANKQIARELQITERTVKAHLTHIFQRIGVSDRTQAALWAHEHLPGI